MFIEFALIFTSALLFIGIIKKYAPYWGLMDIPNVRSMHKKHTPISAGIGFSLAVFLVLAIFHGHMLISYIWSSLAVVLIVIIGVLDDHRDAAPHSKFFVIIISTVLLYFDDIVINELGIFFGFNLPLGWFALPFTLFAVAGFTNALNLIDGLDGLAGSISLIILSTFYFIGYTHDDHFIMMISGSFILAIIAFLTYNWHPATIFMGDSGSLTLGFIISLLAIKSLEYISPVNILFITAIPILDTLIAMIRRKINGLSMFSPDKCHIHHILLSFFQNSIPKTVIFLALLQAIYSLIGLLVETDTNGEYLLVLFLLNISILYLLIGTMIKKQKRKC